MITLDRLATSFCFVMLATQAALGSNSEVFTFFHENVMGTAMRLEVRAETARAANEAEAAALKEIDRLSAIFSGYDKASELNRWMAGPGAPRQVSPELFEVLERADFFREQTQGAFDPRVETFSKLWANAEKANQLPTDQEILSARAIASLPAWRLDPLAGTAERLSDVAISLNAIAKGYIVEKACERALMRSPDVKGVLLSIGGDLRSQGEHAPLIGIAPPRSDSENAEPIAFVQAKDRAIATSGDSQRGFTIQNQWFSHILDPATGKPTAGRASAIVIARNSADADAIATALNVLTPDAGIRLVEGLDDVEAMIVKADGQIWKSRGWNLFERENPALLARAEPGPTQKVEPPKIEIPDGWWGIENEVLVSFEIQNPDAAGRYRRPYVAVWVENADGLPVRNLAVWISFGGAGPYQWLPDLKRWYRADAKRRKVDKTDMVSTLARPTKRPGKYELIWDGKDDKGKPLPAGEYTINIEAAREQGTYQSVKQTVKVGDKPFVHESKAEVELKAISMTYRHKEASPQK